MLPRMAGLDVKPPATAPSTINPVEDIDLQPGLVS